MKNRQGELELYVHIPFCVRKCSYCDFLSFFAGKEQQEQYVQALLKEIKAVNTGNFGRVSSVFIGGGTPSVLAPAQTERILEALRENFEFAPNAEITMEANPGTLDREKLAACRRAGINRLSLGLQSPQDEELKALGRIHTFREFRENFSLAREEGFDNVNVDLMFAIPGQGREDWAQNLHRVAQLGPEHISAYSLIVEEGTPFASQKLDLPDEETEYAMYEDTAEILRGYGYGQYEISNYAKEGFACRHNIGYWRRVNYLGLGLGASSLLDDQRFSNTRSMEQYLRLSGDPSQIRCMEPPLTREDAMGEFMFLGLRMSSGVSRVEFERNFGCSMESVYGRTLEKYCSLGLLAEERQRVFLTRRGIHVSNAVMADFLL